ncbi:TetR/AcrR family transcriptional regulator [Rhodococcus indonesiensis]|uniref:TetR/AcrR family transcriptional regulator n=1 Tax=Rhodococcus indonesiensis TaxID=3055869 RepID=UPI0039F7332C
MTEATSREAMIDAAERIIAEKGIASMTLKGVQLAANQGNKSAAKYHFGSREGLLEAIVEARMAPVNARRQELLDDMNRLGALVTIRQAVEALVRPLAAETLGRPGSRYARFMVQALTDPALADIMQKHMNGESYRRVHQLMVELSCAGHASAVRRANNVVMLTMAALAAQEGRVRTPEQTAEIVSDLVDSCAAVLGAPNSPAAPEPRGVTP